MRAIKFIYNIPDKYFTEEIVDSFENVNSAKLKGEDNIENLNDEIKLNSDT
ncbi:MAG: hypothetical protein ACK4OM_01795 [Alphaproteobacteria bacterium]